MTTEQRRAISNHCRLASETLRFPPRFSLNGATVIVTVNSGYE